MLEQEITIESSGNRLSGTLCLPGEQGSFPVVLMVHGSGPMDRDENMTAQKLNVFNALAHDLAARGIASLRYDKRGCGKSSGDYYTAGHFDLVSDAMHWVDALKEFDVCDSERIFILGHSEGCIIAPQVSLRRPAVAGLILLCPFVENMESILIRQAGQLQREIEGQPGLGRPFRKLLARITGLTVTRQQRLIRRLKTSQEATIKLGFQKIPARQIREMIHLDPPAIFREVTCPMLLIGGEKDLQCNPEDVRQIAGLVESPVETQVIEDLTHALRLDERPPTMLGIRDLLDKPVEPIVLERIAGWLTQQCFSGLQPG
jgi:pimeloyl-ACP methyl ester carboxylesterase